MKSEANLTTFEAISMIVGNSIGTGIIAVPYLATKNSILDVVWMVALAYIVNVILHLIIAELSYNNGGVQIVKSFEGELFHGFAKKVFSWIVFVVYGLAIMIGVSGNKSHLRCDRNRTLSSTYGCINHRVCCWIADPIELGGMHVRVRYISTNRQGYFYTKDTGGPGFPDPAADRSASGLRFSVERERQAGAGRGEQDNRKVKTGSDRADR